MSVKRWKDEVFFFMFKTKEKKNNKKTKQNKTKQQMIKIKFGHTYYETFVVHT